MAVLNRHARSSNTPSPIYGIRPGFNVGDLDPQYKPMMPVFPGVGPGFLPTAQTSGAISPEMDLGARAVKIAVEVAGAGAADVQVYSAADGYVSIVAAFVGLTAGAYEFYVGGWSSPKPDPNNNDVYVATQYGPNGANSQSFTGLSPSTDNNYVGGAYNPVNYLSLDGYPIKIATANYAGGSPGVTIQVVGIS